MLIMHAKHKDTEANASRGVSRYAQLSLVPIVPTQDGQAELTWIVGYIRTWFTYPQTVTHPGTNRARRRVTNVERT